MRIAILTNDYPPASTGGAGRIAKLYSDLLAARGHGVRVWGPRAAYRELPLMSVSRRLAFHIRDLFCDRGLAREISEWHPSVLITHNLTGCGFGTPRRVGATRWIHILHDVQLVDPSGKIVVGESHRLLRAYWRWKWSIARRLALGAPDAVVSPTQWLMEFHEKYGFFKTTKREIIPNPVPSSSRMRGPTGGPGVDSRLHGNDEGGRTHDRKRVLFVGRLDLDKGVGLLLDAWSDVRHEASRLILVGDGALKQRAKDMAELNIEIRGALDSKGVAAEMRKVGVVVVPSRVLENQPTVILEALAAGCRVVASNVGGIRETLDAAGWIVEPNSVESLAQGIKDALAAQEDPVREEAVRGVLAKHDPEKAVEKLEGLF